MNKELENFAKSHFKKLSKLLNWDNRESEYNKWLSENSRLIEISDYKNLELDKEVMHIINRNMLNTPSQCFYNSGKLATTLIDKVKYCEGFIIVGKMPLVEHSWISYNNEYYDITCSPNGINNDGLILVKEFDFQEILDSQLRLKTWGPYLKDYFINNIYEKKDNSNK